MKTLGVIGGLGPMATAYFLELLIQMTEAACDQEHVDAIIYNRPSTPDRTAYIQDSSKPSPLPVLIDAGNQLVKQHACTIAIPCITSHYFYHELTAQIPVPIINIVTETVAHLKSNGIQSVGIMATSGTIQTALFQKALIDNQMTPVVPSAMMQTDVMHLIYNNIKAGRSPEMDRFHNVSNALRADGAEAIILGCTELSVIKKNYPIGAGYIDAMEVLARQSVLACDKPLRSEYWNLITN